MSRRGSHKSRKSRKKDKEEAPMEEEDLGIMKLKALRRRKNANKKDKKKLKMLFKEEKLKKQNLEKLRLKEAADDPVTLHSVDSSTPSVLARRRKGRKAGKLKKAVVAGIVQTLEGLCLDENNPDKINILGRLSLKENSTDKHEDGEEEGAEPFDGAFLEAGRKKKKSGSKEKAEEKAYRRLKKHLAKRRSDSVVLDPAAPRPSADETELLDELPFKLINPEEWRLPANKKERKESKRRLKRRRKEEAKMKKKKGPCRRDVLKPPTLKL